MPYVAPAAATPSASARRPVRSTPVPVTTAVTAPSTNRPAATRPRLASTTPPPDPKKKGMTGMIAPMANKEERGDRRLPGRAAQVLRVDPQLLAHLGVQEGVRVVHHLACGPFRRFPPHALRLIDQRELCLLAFRHQQDLFAFGLDLRCVQLT